MLGNKRKTTDLPVAVLNGGGTEIHSAFCLRGNRDNFAALRLQNLLVVELCRSHLCAKK